jgi:endonuclease YncB( thermonuclease family)
LFLLIAAAWFYWRQKYWIIGTAIAISGHTLQIGKKRIRLHALTALHIGYGGKAGQPWIDHNGVSHDGGQICRNALKHLIEGKTVKCRLRQSARPHRRFYVQAYVDCEDIGKWMVAHGYAVADTKFHRRYISDEKKAKRRKNGIWRGQFENPIIWEKKRANELVLHPAYQRRYPGGKVPDDPWEIWDMIELAWDLRGIVDPTTALLPGEDEILFDLLSAS